MADLLHAAHATGLPVVEVDGWRERGSRRLSPRGVLCHHTATSGKARGDYPSLGTVRDGRADLAGPLANLGLGRSGAVYVIAGRAANHAGLGSWPGISDGNGQLIGIEAESPGDGTWTAAQRDAYPRLCAALCREYDLPAGRVIAHREWAPRRKPDPVGIDMDDLRTAVGRLLTTEDDMATVPQTEWEAVKAQVGALTYALIPEGGTNSQGEPVKRLRDLHGLLVGLEQRIRDGVRASLAEIAPGADIDEQALADALLRRVLTEGAK